MHFSINTMQTLSINGNFTSCMYWMPSFCQFENVSVFVAFWTRGNKYIFQRFISVWRSLNENPYYCYIVIKDYPRWFLNFFLDLSFYIFILFDHKMKTTCDITQHYVLCKNLNREHMFYSVSGMCWWPSIQNGVHCQM